MWWPKEFPHREFYFCSAPHGEDNEINANCEMCFLKGRQDKESGNVKDRDENVIGHRGHVEDDVKKDRQMLRGFILSFSNRNEYSIGQQVQKRDFNQFFPDGILDFDFVDTQSR